MVQQLKILLCLPARFFPLVKHMLLSAMLQVCALIIKEFKESAIYCKGSRSNKQNINSNIKRHNTDCIYHHIAQHSESLEYFFRHTSDCTHE